MVENINLRCFGVFKNRRNLKSPILVVFNFGIYFFKIALRYRPKIPNGYKTGVKIENGCPALRRVQRKTRNLTKVVFT